MSDGSHAPLLVQEDTESDVKYTESIDLCGRISNKLEEALKESDSSGKSKVNKTKVTLSTTLS